MPQPLAGFRIADFSHVMSGPFASHFLCLLGAEVIKIEPLGRGDMFRDYDPDPAYDGMAPAFICANAGKKSVALDLKRADDLEAARRLIASADVVLENFRPGVMDRLGLGYAAARALNPLIIYCSLTGYGQDGPMRDYPAIDNVVQAAAGVMSVSGEAEGPPIRMGVPVVDTYAGTLAALAIVSALLQRSRFGGGQRIDVAMFDAALVFLTAAVTTYLVKGEPPPRTGNVGYSAQPTAGLFRCGDGRYVSLGVVRQGQFETLCRVLDQQNLVADPRFADVRARRAHAGELAAILQGLFLTRPSEEWETRLSAVGCPCGVVRDVGEACELGQVSHRGLKLPIRVPGLPNRQDVHVLNAGFRFAHDGPHVSAPPPRLGEHTEAVLAALGLPPHA